VAALHSAILKNAAELNVRAAFDSRICTLRSGSASRDADANNEIPDRYRIAENPAAAWIAQIKSIWASTKHHTIELAKIIFTAKCELRYGQWTEMWKSGQIPFSKRKGEMLMLIGKNLGGLDAQDSAHLPSAWNTLYYLARLDRPVLENWILEGVVHSALTLREAKELVSKLREPVRINPGKEILGSLSFYET
jgi:hypothetical protein